MNCFQSDYSIDIALREEIYKDRNRRIEEVCNKYKKIYKSSAQGKFFLFDFSHKLDVCFHPKVGINQNTDDYVLYN